MGTDYPGHKFVIILVGAIVNGLLVYALGDMSVFWSLILVAYTAAAIHSLENRVALYRTLGALLGIVIIAIGVYYSKTLAGLWAIALLNYALTSVFPNRAELEESS